MRDAGRWRILVPAATARPRDGAIAAIAATAADHPGREPRLSSTRIVAKNTFLLTVGLLSGRLLAVLLLKKMTPLLGPDGLGIWGLATDLTTIFLVVANFGLSTLVTREVARDRSSTWPILRAALQVRWLMGAVCYLFLVLYVEVQGLDRVAMAAVLVSGVAVFVEASAMACDAVLQAHDRVEYQTYGQIVSAVVYFVVAWLLLEAGAGVMGVIWANLLSRVVRLAVMVPLMLLKTGPWRRAPAGAPAGAPAAAAPAGAPVAAAPSGFRWMLRMGWPLFLSTTFGILYYKVDTVMLMGFLGEAAVGVYVLGHRALDTLMMGPNLFATALFPAMVRYGDGRGEDVTRMGERALRYMMLASLPLTLLCALAAGPIIRWFADGTTGGFADSIPVLKVVIWGLPFAAASTIFSRVLIAAGRERDFVAVSLTAMLVNVGLNLLLIPRYSYFGAAAATILGLATSCLMLLRFIRRAGVPLAIGRAIAGSLTALAAAWAGTFLLVRLLRPAWGIGPLALPATGWGPFLGALGLLGALYVAAVLGLRLLRRDDLGLLRQLVGRG